MATTLCFVLSSKHTKFMFGSLLSFERLDYNQHYRLTDTTTY